MSVLIEGMDIPFTCLTCDFHKCAGGVGDFCTLAKKRQFRFKNRPAWCPLVEIPPHGRLGDLDALLDDIEHSIVFSGKDCSQAIAGAQKVIERIKAAPTIIESDGMESFIKHFED